jgi:hypothetical protein
MIVCVLRRIYVSVANVKAGVKRKVLRKAKARSIPLATPPSGVAKGDPRGDRNFRLSFSHQMVTKIKGNISNSFRAR